jgi:hypothetical protein
MISIWWEEAFLLGGFIFFCETRECLKTIDLGQAINNKKERKKSTNLNIQTSKYIFIGYQKKICSVNTNSEHFVALSYCINPNVVLILSNCNFIMADLKKKYCIQKGRILITF